MTPDPLMSLAALSKPQTPVPGPDQPWRPVRFVRFPEFLFPEMEEA